MKKMTRLLALLMALLMALSASALGETAEEPAPLEDPVLFTLDGTTFTKSQVDEQLADMLAAGYVDSQSDYQTVIDYMIQDIVIQDKISELKLDQYTEAEKAAYAAQAKEEWDDLLDNYVSYYLTEDSEEARAEKRKEAEELYAEYGYSEEMILNNLLLQDSYERLQNSVCGDMVVNVSDADIRAVFDEYAAQDKDVYEDNVSLYELYSSYGQEIWYQPAGFRGVLHILLSVDEALMTTYQDAQNAYEESLSSDGAEGADSQKLLSAAEAARQAILDSQKAILDDIYAKLAAGTPFTDLIKLYNSDPGMEDEATLKEGYPVHQESVIYDSAFVSAAFSEKMHKPGDVSDPAVGVNGVHVVYYLRDIPAGPIELSSEIAEQIRQYLVNVQRNDVFNEAIDGWLKGHEILRNEEAIAAAIAEAEAAAPIGDSEELDLSSLFGDGIELVEMTDDDPDAAE